MSTEVVKSCARVLEVLSMFSERRRSANAAEISQALGYPKSSTNALLKSLVQLGYLSIDIESMRYFPTLRVTHLGDWIPSVLLGAGDASAMLKALHEATQETVTLSMQNGLFMEFIRVIPGNFPIALQIEEGLQASLFGTSVGTAALMTKEDRTIENLYERAFPGAPQKHKGPTLENVMRDVRHAREQNHAIAYDQLMPDTGAVAVPIVVPGSEQTLVIAAGGLSARIRANESTIVAALLRLRNQRQWRQKKSRKHSVG